MSKYFEIDAQSKFRIPKNDELTGGVTGLITDIGRLMYSEADERLYLRGFSTWISISTPLDVLNQGTKMLFGAYPLPTGWQMDTSLNDRVMLLETNSSHIGNTGGSWTITGMNNNGSHTHICDPWATTTLEVDYSTIALLTSSAYHKHTISSDNSHTHSYASGWRPYNIKYCIGEYDPDPYIPPSLDFQKDADPTVSVWIYLNLPAGKNCVIAWGDEDTTDVIGSGSDEYYNHVYGDTGTNYAIQITGDISSLTYFDINNYPYSCNLSAFAELTALTKLNVSDTNIDGDISGISGLTSLKYLYLDESSVTGNISGISTLTVLEELKLTLLNVTGAISALSPLTSLKIVYVNSTNVSGDLADLSPLINLGYISLSGCSNVDTYTQGTLPNWDACNIMFRNLTLSQQEVDDFLCDLNAASVSSTKYLYIDGTNAAPSSTGLACKSSLQGKGWTIHTT